MQVSCDRVALSTFLGPPVIEHSLERLLPMLHALFFFSFLLCVSYRKNSLSSGVDPRVVAGLTSYI